MDLETPDSYATQFFGFTPDSFVENIHVPSIEIINEHLEAAKERIASEFVGKVNKKELDEGFVNIKSTYVSNTEEIFYKFGKYLKKNILAIPSDIVLPEDHPHIEPEGRNYNSHQLQEDLAQTKKLHQEILNAMYQKAVLKTKLANLQIVANRQQDLVKQAKDFRSQKRWKGLLLESEVQKFQEEMSKLKPVIDKIENDFPEETYFRKNLKQRLDLEAVYVARKMKLGKDNQTDPRE